MINIKKINLIDINDYYYVLQKIIHNMPLCNQNKLIPYITYYRI